MIVVDFFGVPGSGKSTISHKLSENLKNSNFSVEEPTYVSAHTKNGVLRRIGKIWCLFCFCFDKRYRALKAIVKQNKYFGIDAIRQEMNIVFKIRSIEKSESDIIIFDEGLMQSAVSLAMNDSKSDVASICHRLYELVDVDPNKVIPVYIEQDADTVLKRLELRSTNLSRAEKIKNMQERKAFIEDADLKCKNLVTDSTITMSSTEFQFNDIENRITQLMES